METVKEKGIADFTDDEIRSEHESRFGLPDEPDLSDWTSADLIEELEDRGTLPEPDDVPCDEIMELIAEAARVSPYAAKAYDLLRDADPNGVMSLAARQRLIANRMGGVA